MELRRGRRGPERARGCPRPQHTGDTLFSGSEHTLEGAVEGISAGVKGSLAAFGSGLSVSHLAS